MTTDTGAAALIGEPTGQQPPAGQPPASEPPAQSASNDAWYATLVQNDDIKNWAANKNFKDAGAALESSYNLEKLIGFEKAGRTLVLPKDDAPVEEQRAFWQKLGAPEKAEDYKLPIPEGEAVSSPR
jgi:hypothetical protein